MTEPVFHYLDKADLIPGQFAALSRSPDPVAIDAAVLQSEPQWIFQSTVLAHAALASTSPITSTSRAERVVFDVTEHYLIARRVTPGALRNCAAGAACEGTSLPSGDVVAVFRIHAHFDADSAGQPRRPHDRPPILQPLAATRPWFQRRYLRVDWSMNLATDYRPREEVSWPGRIRATPIAFGIDIVGHPMGPVYDFVPTPSGDARLHYFDVTSRALLEPEPPAGSATGTPSVCASLGRDACASVDVTLRSAFLRVDPAREYEPHIATTDDVRRFPTFTSVSVTPTLPERGASSIATHAWSQRHNLWQSHFMPPATGELDHRPDDLACGRDDDCIPAGPSARCDSASHTCGDRFRRCRADDTQATPELRIAAADAQCGEIGSGARCALSVSLGRRGAWGLCARPLRERRVRPLVYHLSPEYPEALMPVTNAAVQEWQRVFASVVREARYRECLLDDRRGSDGGSSAACADWREPGVRGPHAAVAADASTAFVACHNPVWGTEAGDGQVTAAALAEARRGGWGDGLTACGAQGTRARMGDLRWNTLAAITDFDALGPWGLASTAADPTTGEIRSARASVSLRETYAQASTATDLLRILNGDLGEAEWILSSGQAAHEQYLRLVFPESRSPDGTGTWSFADRMDQALGNLTATNGGRFMNAAWGVTTDVSHAPPEGAGAPNEVPDRNWRLLIDRATRVVQVVDPSRPGRTIAQMRRDEEALLSVLAASLETSTSSPADADRRRGFLRDTSIEQAIVGRDLTAAFGGSDAPNRPADWLEQASPLRRHTLADHLARRAAEYRRASVDCSYESAPVAASALARLLRAVRTGATEDLPLFGRAWTFHARSSPASCEATPSGPSDPCRIDWAEVQRYLVQLAHYGVLLHEVGHSVGARHNFSGSADAMNYRDRYWQLRGYHGLAAGLEPRIATQLQPRWAVLNRETAFNAPAERSGGIDEYATSTVMDYRAWIDNAHGLGRYDRAFVAHTYVGMVEAFRHVADADLARNVAESSWAQWGGPVALAITGTPLNPLPTAFHYTDVARIVGATTTTGADPERPSETRGFSVPDVGDGNRFWVFENETARMSINAAGWDPAYPNVATAGPDGRAGESVVVAYRAGTDEDADRLWHTTRGDSGADPYEAARSLVRGYLDNYGQLSFARDRTTFDVAAYERIVRSRYLDPLFWQMRSVFAVHRLHQVVAGPVSDVSPWYNSVAVRTAAVAAYAIIDLYALVLRMPDTGTGVGLQGAYSLRARPDGEAIWAPSSTGRTITPMLGAALLEGGTARSFASWPSFGSPGVSRSLVGWYHDKRMALEYMTATLTRPPDAPLSYFGDRAPFSVSAVAALPVQSERWFGSLLSRDYADVGPQLRPQRGAAPLVEYPSLMVCNLPAGLGPAGNGRDPALNAIDPAVSYSLEVELAARLFTEFTDDARVRVVDSLRLWCDGDAWALNAAPDRTFVQFTDPLSRISYFAEHRGAGTGEPGQAVGLSRRDAPANETGIAARMLRHADVLRGAYETATPQDRVSRELELREYMALLRSVRDLNAHFVTAGRSR